MECDAVELCQAREIVRGDDLGMLDTVAAVALAIGFGRRFENIEGDAGLARRDGVEN